MKKPTPTRIARESRCFLPSLAFLSDTYFRKRVGMNPEHARRALEAAIAECRSILAQPIRRVDVSTPEQANPSSQYWFPATRFTVYGRTDKQIQLEMFLAWRDIVWMEKRDACALGLHEAPEKFTPDSAILNTKRLPPGTVCKDVEVRPDECPQSLRTDPSEERVRAMFAAALDMDCLLPPPTK